MTAPTTHDIAIVYLNRQGEFRVHAAGCRDVAADARRSDAGAHHLTVSGRSDADEWMWGDIAADEAEPGSDAWRELCADYADAESVYLPCSPVR